MRLFLFLLLSAALVPVANATSFDTITFDFPSRSVPSPFPGSPPVPVAGVDFSAVLPASPAPVAAPFGPQPTSGFFYNTDGLPFDEQPINAPGYTLFFGPGIVTSVLTADVNYPRALYAFDLTSAASLYTGPDTAPTLVPGVYQADYVLTVFRTYDLPGTITIAPVATSAVPEPTSLVLAASGALALLGAGRLRRAKTAKP